MGKTTINQHYVYRDYLRKWSSNEYIYCLLDRKKLLKTNLKNIGLERYFYKVPAFSKEELRIAKLFTDEYTKNIVEVFEKLNNTIAFSKLTNNLKLTENLTNFSKDCDEKYFNCNIENNLKNFIDKILTMNLECLNDLEFKMKSCSAIAEQYCRTKNIKSKFEKDTKLKSLNINLSNIWFLMRHIIASKIGMAICFDNYKFCLLENNNNGFITGDQPIVNTYYNNDTIPLNFELYYPLSPSLALLITKDTNYENYSIIFIEDEIVDFYNNLIVKSSYNQLYADKIEKLEKFISI